MSEENENIESEDQETPENGTPAESEVVVAMTIAEVDAMQNDLKEAQAKANDYHDHCRG